ncbi:MAG: Endoribonuclease YbeY, partial [Bacteroidota bacterium]
GLLHLLGYKDKTDAQAKEMRQEEEACLSLWADLD